MLNKTQGDNFRNHRHVLPFLPFVVHLRLFIFVFGGVIVVDMTLFMWLKKFNKQLFLVNIQLLTSSNKVNVPRIICNKKNKPAAFKHLLCLGNTIIGSKQ